MMRLVLMLLPLLLAAGDPPKRLPDADALKVRELQVEILTAQTTKLQAERAFNEAVKIEKTASDKLQKLLEEHKKKGCDVQPDMTCVTPLDKTEQKK